MSQTKAQLLNPTGVFTLTDQLVGVGATFSANIRAVDGNFSGNVSIAGTLTKEDVTNVDSVGVITARSDISIADKIIHTGDTNTAIRFPSADTFTVELGGSERVRVGSSGEYDDITGSSDAGIVIGSGSFASAGLQIRTSAAGVGRIYFGDNSGSDNGRKDGSIIYGQTSRSMQFATAQTERLRIGSAGQIGLGGANYGTSGQVLTSQGAGAAAQWATASSGLWTTLHQALYTGDDTSDTHLVTGLGGYDMLKLTFMVTVTGHSMSNPLPKMTIGTSSAMNSDNYQSTITSWAPSSNSTNGGQSDYWPYQNVNNFGNPGGDYNHGVLTCEMMIFNWQGTTSHTFGHMDGGYTSGTNQQIAKFIGSVAHRNLGDYDRIQFGWQSASANNLHKLQITIEGATYS